MKGYVPTPDHIVDLMVDKLFNNRKPQTGDRLLDPGCGPGAMIAGVLRWCKLHHCPVPEIVGVELSPERSAEARARFANVPQVSILQQDFLIGEAGQPPFDFVIGNPPYVSITSLSETEKAAYRGRYRAASGRFDLYMLFIEESLQRLREGGRLVFINPEKFLYVGSARALRSMLAKVAVREVHQLPEDTFAGLTTYPVILTVDRTTTETPSQFIRRTGEIIELRWSAEGRSLQAQMQGAELGDHRGPTLADVTLRISAGIATGADRVFVAQRSTLNAELLRFAAPTVSGRQLGASRSLDRATLRDVLLIPYDTHGELLPERCLGALGERLRTAALRDALELRSCARRKPWYAFHDSVPMPDLRRPKILCKDIAPHPRFVLDLTGDIVPRHSVYYIVPRYSELLYPLVDWLNSEPAAQWLLAHCQRAANGYIRLQSKVIRHLPVPDSFLEAIAHTPPTASLGPLFNATATPRAQSTLVT